MHLLQPPLKYFVSSVRSYKYWRKTWTLYGSMSQWYSTALIGGIVSKFGLFMSPTWIPLILKNNWTSWSNKVRWWAIDHFFHIFPVWWKSLSNPKFSVKRATFSSGHGLFGWSVMTQIVIKPSYSKGVGLFNIDGTPNLKFSITTSHTQLDKTDLYSWVCIRAEPWFSSKWIS